MGRMKFEVTHGLPKDEAKKRCEALFAYWQKKYGLQSQWAGDGCRLSGKVMGIQFDATVQVADKAVAGEGTDPGMLLRGQAQKYLTRKFGEYLDPGKRVEDLGRADD